MMNSSYLMKRLIIISILQRSQLLRSFKYPLLQLPGRWSVKSPYIGVQQHRVYPEIIIDNKAENILKYKNITIEI